jgi:hypothetical protein
MKRLWSMSLGLVAACTVACGPGAPASSNDGGAGDGGDDAASLVTFSATVRGLDDVPVGGASVSFAEAATLSATTASDGTFSLSVPAQAPLTTLITAPGFVETVTQTVVFTADSSGASFRMATTAQYEYLKSFGNVPVGAGVMRVDVITDGSCAYAGAHLGTTPASGTTVYMQPDQLPNASYTALQPSAPGAFVIGVSGTVVPVITDVPSPCAQVAWPVDQMGVSIVGPITIRDGAYHDVAVYVK